MCATRARLAIVPASLYAGKKMDRPGRFIDSCRAKKSSTHPGKASNAREPAGEEPAQGGEGEGAEDEARGEAARVVGELDAVGPRTQHDSHVDGVRAHE